MPTSTAHRALHVPTASDVPDVPNDILALANQLDFDLFVVSGTSRPAAGTLGRVYYNTSTTLYSFDTGLAWIDFLTAVPGGTYLLLAGGTLSGPLDLNGQELRNAIVLNARDKRATSSVSGAVTINADNGPSQTLTLTGAVTSITLTNFSDGESLRVTFLQDATGGRTVAWPNTWLWPGGATLVTPNFKTTANARNTVVLDMVGSTVEAFLAADQKV